MRNFRYASQTDLRQDPNTPPIGRAPYNVQIAPSKDYPWYGGIVGGQVVHGASGPIAIAGGERFTVQQARVLADMALDPEAVETMTVKRQATTQEMWVGLGRLPPVYAFECPVVGHHGEKVRVIAPSGAKKLVAADGWAHRPIRVARDMWGSPLPRPEAWGGSR